MSDDQDLATFEDVGTPERDKPPFMRLPEPATLFARRAERFAALAPGHQLEAYLTFLAGLSRAQATLVAAIGTPGMPPPAELRLRAVNAMPVLPREELAGAPAVSDAFDRLAELLAGVAMPDLARAALARAVSAQPEARQAMFTAVLADAVPVEAVAEHIFAAAALQVVAAGRSARLDPALPSRSQTVSAPAAAGRRSRARSSPTSMSRACAMSSARSARHNGTMSG